MADMTSRLENTKRITSLMREFFLVGVIILLVISPRTIKHILQNAGIQSIAGVEFRNDLEKTSNDTKKAILQIITLRDSLNILQTKLSQAIDQAGDVNTKKDLRAIQSTINATTEKADNLDLSLKSSLSRQEQVIQQIDISAKLETGWIFLGKVNESKLAWSEGHPETVESAELPIQVNALLKIKTDTYLRADIKKQKSKAKIISVVKEEEVVEVIEIDYSHAKGGGWFVWVKVKRT